MKRKQQQWTVEYLEDWRNQLEKRKGEQARHEEDMAKKANLKKREEAILEVVKARESRERRKFLNIKEAREKLEEAISRQTF